MAKKKVNDGVFPGMEDNTPAELIELGQAYKKAQSAAAKAKEKEKAAKLAVIEKMHELEVPKFRLEIDGNMKWLTIVDNESLKFEKSETSPPQSDPE